MEIFETIDTITVAEFMGIVYKSFFPITRCVHTDEFTLCFCRKIKFIDDFLSNNIVAFRMTIPGLDINLDCICPVYNHNGGHGCWPSIFRNNGIRYDLRGEHDNIPIKDILNSISRTKRAVH